MTGTPIVPIVMAGGAGTRLWPLSRETMPKQFIPLLSGGLSTFQATLLRVRDPRFTAPIVITNHEFRFVVAEQMQMLQIDGDIILEPERRDSAPAVAVGALLAQAREPRAVGLALAADHVVRNVDLFREDCVAAAAIAAEGFIMTLGIVPTCPSTAYGYIEVGDALETGSSEVRAHRLAQFVEKPDAATAQRYCAEGLLWNSGNFVFSLETMLSELEAFAPDVLAGAGAAVEGVKADLDFYRLDSAGFARAPRISIDYAVMEKTRHAGVLEACFDWSDVGAWDAIHDLKAKDENDNVLEGNVLALDSRGSLVRSEEILTTVIGLSEVVVVSTRDAVLVASKSSAGKVKDLVQTLKRSNHREADEHLRIHRPWGWYQRIDIGTRFQVKRLSVKPGHKLSLQKHFHRAEHWVVVSGTAEVTRDGTVSYLHENESVYLPIGCIHRLHNPGKIDLELIEVQVGSYTGEDDIVRLEDVYARV